MQIIGKAQLFVIHYIFGFLNFRLIQRFFHIINAFFLPCEQWFPLHYAEKKPLRVALRFFEKPPSSAMDE